MADGQPGDATLAARLRDARERRFVGRAAELELFREALASSPPPFAVLFIHGPGGIGKTTLLEALAREAAAAGVEAARVDLRSIEPSPDGLLAALASALGLEPDEDPLEALASGPRRALLLDTHEAIGGLDSWLREGFLPRLRDDAIVVVAGRRPPSPEWTADEGWRELVRVVSLRNLDPEAVAAYLGRAGVPAERHEAALALTHGHPLALSLLADVLAQGAPGEAPLDLAELPDVVPPLLERFIAGVPSPQHREALQVSAHARYTTESLLRAVLGGEDAAALFTWLRGLSFVEEGPEGAFPHDLARDVIEADLRWRDPDRYSSMHRGVRAHVRERIAAASGPEQRRAVTDLVFLHRSNPVVRPFWDWDTFGKAYAGALQPSDRAALLEMTERHEGSESAAIAERWMERQPEAFAVVRMGRDEPIGYVALLALHEADREDIEADPGAAAMWEHAQRTAPPLPGEEVHAGRFLVDREAYQAPSPTQNLTTIVHTQRMLGRERPAWDFIGAYTDPDAMEPILNHIDYHRVPEAEFEVGGMRHGVFAHDWRRVGPDEWLDLMASREIAAEPPERPSGAAAHVLALSHDEFAASTRAALRALHNDEELARNPLMASRAVRDAAEGVPGPEHLRDLLGEAIEALRVDPRDAKLHAALARTFVRPAGTQELAAEALGLPFSTYRRHLARGTDRVVEWLWRRELHGPGGR